MNKPPIYRSLSEYAYINLEEDGITLGTRKERGDSIVHFDIDEMFELRDILNELVTGD